MRIAYLVFATAWMLATRSHGSEQSGFSVRESIAMQQFIDPDPDSTGQVKQFSPNGKYFIAVTQRGLLKEDRVQSTIWLFDVAAEREFLSKREVGREPPQPRTLATLAGMTEPQEQQRESVAIASVHWSADSNEVLFLGREASFEWHLYKVDIRTGALLQLTPNGQNVVAYSAIGPVTVYAVSIPFMPAPLARAVVGTGQALAMLLSPDQQRSYPNQNELWVYGQGTVHPVVDSASGRPVRLNKHFDSDSVILSPSSDGHFAVVSQAVSSIPASWEEYEPGADVGKIAAVEPSRLARASAYEVPERFVLVDLLTGQSALMVDGPLGRGASWVSPTQAIWSRDGREVLLSNVFLPPDNVPEPEMRRRMHAPAIVLYDISTRKPTEVVSLKRSSRSDPKRWGVVDINWNDTTENVTVRYSNGGPAAEAYRRSGGIWRLAGHANKLASGNGESPIGVSVRQGLNTPPTLYASVSRKTVERKIWDPNPRLGAINLGAAEVYDWKDRHDRVIKGVLIKPPQFDPGRRYPLVIEPRAYFQNRFVIDGTYSTAVAARAMAADGLLVLQAGEPPAPEQSMFNGATARALEGYEAVISRLTTEGLVDPNRVGIIGFSRTCDTVLYAITHNPRLFAAATLANGLTYGPMQYMAYVDSTAVEKAASEQWDLHYDGKPFGDALRSYIQTNPVFSVAAVSAAVRVETRGPSSVLGLLTDWEPYAALRSLGKPVDLIALPYATHVVSMPSDLLESQQGDVEWMRFWLQGYEDPDPMKAKQYRRWEQLCDLQIAGNPGRPAFCIATKH